MKSDIRSDAATLACLLMADPVCHRMRALHEKTGWERDRFNLALAHLLTALPDIVALGEVEADCTTLHLVRRIDDHRLLRSFVKQVEAELDPGP